MSEAFSIKKVRALQQASWFLSGINIVVRDECLDGMIKAVDSASIILQGESNIHRRTNEELFNMMQRLLHEYQAHNGFNPKTMKEAREILDKYKDNLEF